MVPNDDDDNTRRWEWGRLAIEVEQNRNGLWLGVNIGTKIPYTDSIFYAGFDLGRFSLRLYYA